MNPNHDPKTGKFASGKGGNAPSSNKALNTAWSQASRAREVFLGMKAKGVTGPKLKGTE